MRNTVFVFIVLVLVVFCGKTTCGCELSVQSYYPINEQKLYIKIQGLKTCTVGKIKIFPWIHNDRYPNYSSWNYDYISVDDKITLNIDDNNRFSAVTIVAGKFSRKIQVMDYSNPITLDPRDGEENNICSGPKKAYENYAVFILSSSSTIKEYKKALGALTQQQYLFENENVRVLYEPLTRTSVINAFEKLRCNDIETLLIYYSGHGDSDYIGSYRVNDRWLLSKNESFEFAMLKLEIIGLNPKNVVIISNSCSSVGLPNLKTDLYNNGISTFFAVNTNIEPPTKSTECSDAGFTTCFDKDIYYILNEECNYKNILSSSEEDQFDDIGRCKLYDKFENALRREEQCRYKKSDVLLNCENKHIYLDGEVNSEHEKRFRANFHIEIKNINRKKLNTPLFMESIEKDKIGEGRELKGFKEDVTFNLPNPYSNEFCFRFHWKPKKFPYDELQCYVFMKDISEDNSLVFDVSTMKIYQPGNDGYSCNSEKYDPALKKIMNVIKLGLSVKSPLFAGTADKNSYEKAQKACPSILPNYNSTYSGGL